MEKTICILEIHVTKNGRYQGICHYGRHENTDSIIKAIYNALKIYDNDEEIALHGEYFMKYPNGEEGLAKFIELK